MLLASAGWPGYGACWPGLAPLTQCSESHRLERERGLCGSPPIAHVCAVSAFPRLGLPPLGPGQTSLCSVLASLRLKGGGPEGKERPGASEGMGLFTLEKGLGVTAMSQGEAELELAAATLGDWVQPSSTVDF